MSSLLSRTLPHPVQKGKRTDCSGRQKDNTSWGVMDVNFFKNRGKTWMGDIYQKVEGMLQDVDGVIK